MTKMKRLFDLIWCTGGNAFQELWVMLISACENLEVPGIALSIITICYIYQLSINCQLSVNPYENQV